MSVTNLIFSVTENGYNSVHSYFKKVSSMKTLNLIIIMNILKCSLKWIFISCMYPCIMTPYLYSYTLL